MHPLPGLVAGPVVGPRVHQHLVVPEDGGALAAPQHPDHSVPLEAGGPLPGEQHLGAGDPGVVLERPPPAHGGHLVLSVRAPAHQDLVPDEGGVGAGVQGVGGQHGLHVLAHTHPVHSGALQPQGGGGQGCVTPHAGHLVLGGPGQRDQLGRVKRPGVGLPLHPRVAAHQQPVLGQILSGRSIMKPRRICQEQTNSAKFSEILLSDLFCLHSLFRYIEERSHWLFSVFVCVCLTCVC